MQQVALDSKEPSYTEAVALLGGLVVGLLCLQALRTPSIPHMATAPAAWCIFAPMAVLFTIGLAWSKNVLVRFLSGVPFAIVSLIFTTIGALLGTLIVQHPRAGDALGMLQKLGLTDVFHTPWFAALVLSLVVNLSLASGRRMRDVRFSDVVFCTTHVGTALVLAGGLFGNLSSVQGTLRLHPGKANGTLELDAGKTLELPFSLVLTSFSVEPFPLELTLGERMDEGVVPRKGGKPLPALTPGKSLDIAGWRVTCESALPSAEPDLHIMEDPTGRIVLDLRLKAHDSEIQFPLLQEFSPRELPGDRFCGLLEAKENGAAAILALARQALAQDAAMGALFVTDGHRMTTFVKDEAGTCVEKHGDDAFLPIALGPMILTPGRLYRAQVQGTWKAASVLNPQPTGAARVVAEKNGQRKEGWIASGPDGADGLDLEPGVTLMLLNPQPKSFQSDVLLEGRKHVIRVNAPLVHQAWQFTQASYEVASTGQPISVLRAMRDPSLPVVWTGLVMLLVGSMGALWILPNLMKREQA